MQDTGPGMASSSPHLRLVRTAAPPPGTGLVQMRPEQPARAISCKALTKSFHQVAVVDHVDLDIGQGEIFGLIGPNGAGKSTLVKMLTTLLPITSGTATVAGFDLRSQAQQVRWQIGYVPQVLSVDTSLTAHENMLLSARLYGIGGRESQSRIADALALMGLEASRNVAVQNFSGGMIRRLEVAQSLLHRPRILFMDEPTIGLDPAARLAVWAQIRRLKDLYQMTILITSHYLEEIEELCDRVAVMAAGRIVAVGTPDEPKAHFGPHSSMEDVFLRLTTTPTPEETR